MASSSSAPVAPPAYTGFSDLVVDGDSAIKAMVCRSWDVKNPMGKYIGTEYILSDDAGKALHCVARSAIAHCVVSKLQPGGIYGIRRFSVSPNKATYRLRRDDPILINLESNTLIHKLDCATDGFTRQPFMVSALADVAFNKNAFLIDVVGRPVNVGSFKPTRNGSKFLDFDIANERGQSVKVALWGPLGDELIRIINSPDAWPVVLLPAMNIREYKGDLQLSSTSGTIIYSGNDIPEIATMRELIGDKPFHIQRNYGTLLGILNIGREQVGVNDAETVTSVCKVKIIGIRQRTSWNYYSCGEKGCKKGVTPSGLQFWCESCEKICEFPIVRYLLSLEVLDDTTSLLVTLFDEVAESLVKKTAATLLAEAQGRDEEIEYPDEIISLCGTVQDIELKSYTYYNHGQYESFTVTRVLTAPETENVVGNLSSEGDGTQKETGCVAGKAENSSHPVVLEMAATHVAKVNVQIGDQTEGHTSPGPISKKPKHGSEYPDVVLPTPAFMDRQEDVETKTAD